MTTVTPSTQRTLAIDEIVVGENVREIDLAHVEGLAESIKLVGVVTPLLVTPGEGARYELVAGFHRLAAARMAGLNEVPVVVRDSAGSDADGAIENIVRKQLTPHEEAVALQRALDQGLTEEGAATVLAWDMSLVRARKKILDLPEQLRPLVGFGIPLGFVGNLVAIMEAQPRLKPLLAEVLVENDQGLRMAQSPVWFLEHLSSDPAAKKHNVRVTELDGFTIRDLESFGISKSKLRTAPRKKYDAIAAGLKEDWERGPTIQFMPEQIDGARALGVLLEFSGRGDSVVYLLVDDYKSEAMLELVQGALMAYEPPVKKKAAAARPGAKVRTPKEEAEALTRKERNRMRDSIGSAHAAQKVQLLDTLASVEVDMDVARFFVFGLFGRGYEGPHSTVGQGPGVDWWARGIGGLLDPLWEKQPAKSNGGARPDKLRYPLLQPKDDDPPKEDRLKQLWSFLDGAKTPEQLFGRALCVVAASELCIPEVLPTSRRWGTVLSTGGQYGYGTSRQAPRSHDDKAAKALDRLLKKYKVKAPELSAAVKAWLAVPAKSEAAVEAAANASQESS